MVLLRGERRRCHGVTQKTSPCTFSDHPRPSGRGGRSAPAGRPVTLERIAARQGYAITGQEEATVTLTLSREQMPEGFPEEVPISQAEGELKLPCSRTGTPPSISPPLPGLTRTPAPSTPSFSRSISSPGKGDSFSSLTGLTRTAASPPSSGFPTCPCRPTGRTVPMRPGWPARAR
ncbi:hypothetical protein M5E87_26600 [Flavonifractor plautii]|nr:hypothetical protein M5E87_26600 [Flavonifractor plautii]